VAMRPRAVRVGIVGVLVASGLALSAGPSAADESAGATPGVLSAPVQFAQVDGATLGYRVAGSGLPLVLIPGSANTMAEWDPRFLDELAASRRVIVFDNRGAGTSTGDLSDLTIQLMARDTAQLIDQVAGGPADVLGWSMGGYIAQELAIRNPGRVRRLVLVSTDCGGPTTTGPTPRALRILTDPRATTDERMSILFPPSRQGAARAWTAAVGTAFAAGGYQPADAFSITPALAAAQNRAAGPRWLGRGDGTCSRLHRITAPTLVAGGRDDVVVPIVNLRPLAVGIPTSLAVTYRQAGHAFVFQPGLRFAQRVTAFLDRAA
jgi:pimeloyl-ACP methyl ester carboxylesterase